MRTKPTVDVRRIVALYLEEHEFDGIYADGECACRMPDLMPCDGSAADCKPGYLLPCDCGDHEWHIGPDRACDPGGVALKEGDKHD